MSLALISPSWLRLKALTANETTHSPSTSETQSFFLHITGRRDNGYHELETLFQFLTIADTLEFTLNDDGVIRLNSDSPEPIALADNLIYRAAQALQPYCANSKLGADIKLTKRLPMGGGVGGGSSDAATTLLALNQLWNLQLSPSKLAAIGLALGADVPVFVHGQATFARGVGEQFLPANTERKLVFGRSSASSRQYCRNISTFGSAALNCKITRAYAALLGLSMA